jgi:hypothetical protein
MAKHVLFSLVNGDLSGHGIDASPPVSLGFNSQTVNGVERLVRPLALRRSTRERGEMDSVERGKSHTTPTSDETDTEMAQDFYVR